MFDFYFEFYFLHFSRFHLTFATIANGIDIVMSATMLKTLNSTFVFLSMRSDDASAQFETTTPSSA